MTDERVKDIVRRVFHYYDETHTDYNWEEFNEACRIVLSLLGERIATGCRDKYGYHICLGDTVQVRSKKFRLSGRGIVVTDEKWGYAIQDTRTEHECRSRNVGRRYPLKEDEAVEYTILHQSEGDNDEK